jgi:hypothetical protein
VLRKADGEDGEAVIAALEGTGQICQQPDRDFGNAMMQSDIVFCAGVLIRVVVL